MGHGVGGLDGDRLGRFWRRVAPGCRVAVSFLRGMQVDGEQR
jgi:hypothetical protein